MSKNKFSSYIIALSILSIVAVFTIILQSGYNKALEIQKTAVDKSFTSPFNPELDTKILETIKTKESVSPQDSPNHNSASNYASPVNQAVSTSPEATPSAIASPSASP